MRLRAAAAGPTHDLVRAIRKKGAYKSRESVYIFFSQWHVVAD
jgi:hypothetical protein